MARSLDTKNIASNIRYHLAMRGWTQGRFRLHLWRKGVYMHSNTLARILKGDYTLSDTLVKKLALGFGIKRKELTDKIVVRAPHTLEELLMLDDNSMRTFVGGADEASLKWIRDSLLAIRNKNAERKIAYMKRAGPDIVEVKRWLLTGQISDEAFVRIYLDRKPTRPKPLTQRELKEMMGYRERRRELFDRDGKNLRQRQGRPFSPIPAPQKDPPEYWPS